ncbi:hypothetical protein [Albidovulum sp.]|uniref:hypothetical protein n=1 Tax=Albidovulum sp. TaxID=1872424 RepID=UPI0039B9AA86
MGRVLVTASALAIGASTALAGGVERSAQSVGILFEKGNYAEFSIGRVSPDVSGVQQVNAAPASLAGASSGDMAGDYNTYSLGVKLQVNDRIDVALVLDEPVGADVAYAMGSSPAGMNYLYGGSTADINSLGTTALLRFKLPNNLSLIGGVRQISTSGNVALFNGYQMRTSTETDYGYVLGIAWEKPEIAARVALTYNSSVTHDFNASENGLSTSFETEIPQSVNLEAQTGVAADTLVFGSIRWVDWSAFEIAPPAYMGAAGNVFKDPLVSYQDDTFTYTLGVGRKFNDTWSGAAFVTHETGKGGYSGNLGPTDGSTALGLAATYTMDRIKITGGIRYVMIGDAETETPAAIGIPTGSCNLVGDSDCGTFGKFDNNHAVALGLRVAYSF